MIFFALSGPHWWKTLHCFWLVMKILCISGDKTLLEDPNLRSQRLLTNLTNKSLWIGLLHAATPWCRSCLGHNWRVGTAVRVTMVNYPLSKYILRKFSTDDSGPLTLSDAGVWRLYLGLLSCDCEGGCCLRLNWWVSTEQCSLSRVAWAQLTSPRSQKTSFSPSMFESPYPAW